MQRLAWVALGTLLAACSDDPPAPQTVSAAPVAAEIAAPGSVVAVPIPLETSVPEPVDNSALEELDVQRAKLREAQQLHEELQAELDAIRAALADSNRELEQKQAVVESLKSSTAE
ncbi:MAG: hypothetical protein AAF420_10770 [Pseudomonadota bacterium]